MSHADGTGIVENLPERNPERPARRPGALFYFREPCSYVDTWALQQRLHAERCTDLRPDLLLLLEHEPVYTMGRTTQPTHWNGDDTLLRHLGATLQAVDRGGSITFHGPGQLIGYPILKLTGFCKGPKAYVRMLEQVLIDTLDFFGVHGYRIEKRPGIWTQRDGREAKLASIGIRLDRGVTMHGFALNVDVDLAPFSHIVPCGLDRCRMSSMAETLGEAVSIAGVAQKIAWYFGDMFHLEWSCPALIEAQSDAKLSSQHSLSPL